VRAFILLGCVLSSVVVLPLAAQDARPSAGLHAAHAAVDAIYAYTDDRGRLIYANRLQDVPLQLRASAKRVDQDAPSASEASGEGDLITPLLDWMGKPLRARSPEPQLYQYRGRNGRITYTNIADSVPLAQRSAAKLDLKHVPLNSELGMALDQQLKAQYDRLRESSFCKAVESAVNEPFWRRVWREQGPLVACGAAILVFLLITPWMVRKVGGAPWARALSMAIPVLGFAGVMGFILVKSGNSLSQLRDKAAPCDPTSWVAAGQGETALVQRLNLVRALKTETDTLEQIHAESQM
jgi:hypothetical protein